MNLNGRGRDWTLQEEDFLEQWAGKLSLKEFGKKLDRTAQAVGCHMQLLGISNKGEGMTITQVAKEYGAPIQRVRQMIWRKQLPATRISKEHAWIVDPLKLTPAHIKQLSAPRATWNSSPLDRKQHRIKMGQRPWTVPSDADEKPWGYSVTFASEKTYVGKIMYIRSGMRLSLQKHDLKEETVCCIQGQARLKLGEKAFTMKIGKGYTIRRHQIHRITALSNCIVVEASTPERGITTRIEDDFNRSDEILTGVKQNNGRVRLSIKDIESINEALVEG